MGSNVVRVSPGTLGRASTTKDSAFDESDVSPEPIPRMLAIQLNGLNRDLLSSIVFQGLDGLSQKDMRELLIGESVKQLR